MTIKEIQIRLYGAADLDTVGFIRQCFWTAVEFSFSKGNKTLFICWLFCTLFSHLNVNFLRLYIRVGLTKSSLLRPSQRRKSTEKAVFNVYGWVIFLCGYCRAILTVSTKQTKFLFDYIWGWPLGGSITGFHFRLFKIILHKHLLYNSVSLKHCCTWSLKAACPYIFHFLLQYVSKTFIFLKMKHEKSDTGYAPAHLSVRL